MGHGLNLAYFSFKGMSLGEGERGRGMVLSKS